MKHLRTDQKNRLATLSLYDRMLQGDFGSFFDTLGTSPMGESPLFPRLEALLKSKKDSWHSGIPVCTNYAAAIARIITDFALGSGARVMVHHDVDDVATAQFATEFQTFWDSQNIGHILADNLHQVVANGTAGVRLTHNTTGTVLCNSLAFDTIFVDPQTRTTTLCWIIQPTAPTPHDTVAYTIAYTPTDQGQYIAQHQVHVYDPASDTLGDVWPEGLGHIFGQTDLDENGYEPNPHSTLPVSVMQSPTTDAAGNGKSLLSDIVGHIQSLAFLETAANTELETHFLSKMAIPRSMVMTRFDGTPYIESSEYIAFEDGGEIPSYIQKDNKFFADLRAHIKTLKQDISLLTGIPVELFDKEGSQERVDLSRIRRRPFVRLISSYQRVLRMHIERITKSWFALRGVNAPMVEVILPPMDDHTSLDERSMLLQEYQAGLIDKTRWAQQAYPTLTSAEVAELVDTTAE